METDVAKLAATPFETNNDYWRAGSQRARRRRSLSKCSTCRDAPLWRERLYRQCEGAAWLREAYFVAIVTPATKQLRKMLADMAN